MSLNKTPGPDKLSMRILKDCLPVVLAVPLPTLSIAASPHQRSQMIYETSGSEVIPLLKDGDHEVASNNRPLSLLILFKKFVRELFSTNSIPI